MKSVTFQQTDKNRLRLFVFVYFAAFAAVFAYVLFGPQSDHIINFINSFRTGKFIGLVAGLLFSTPLLLLPKLTRFQLTVSLTDAGILLCGNGRKEVIESERIGGMDLNKTRLGRLTLHDRQGKELYSFSLAGHASACKSLIALVRSLVPMTKASARVKTFKILGGEFEASLYTRKDGA